MTRSENVAALAAADELLHDLDLSIDEPVDVFGAINQLGLELAIVPLDGLLGAMLPQGRGGILVTSQRSARLQRYTAAHEIGHWALHRVEPTMDTEADILHTTTDRERQAQLFAAYFLMPPPLVAAVWERYREEDQPITPQQLYLASRDMQVSYEAAARRFYSAKLISNAQLAELTAINRLQALQQQFGRRPADGDADMWHRQYTATPDRVQVFAHDEIVIELPENRTTGWQWLDDADLRRRTQRVQQSRPQPPEPTTHMLPNQPASVPPPLALRVSTDAADARCVQVVDDVFAPTEIPTAPRALAAARRYRATANPAVVDVTTPEVTIGATGHRTIVLRADAIGHATLKLHYAHAFDPTVEPVLSYQVTVDVDPGPTAAYRLQRIQSADLDQRTDDDPDDQSTYSVVTS